MKKKVIYFGDKNSFCIELGFSNSPDKYYLRFWIEGLPMGNFKKSGELEFAKKTYLRILKNPEILIVDKFRQMNANSIFSYCLTITDSTNVEEFKKINSILELSFFGNQFTNTQSFYIIYLEGGFLKFIWQNDFGKPINSAKVDFEIFCSVFNSFAVAGRLPLQVSKRGK